MSLIHEPFKTSIYSNFIDSKEFDIIKQEILSCIDQKFQSFEEGWNCNTKTSYDLPEDFFKSVTLENQIKTNINDYCKSWEFRNPLNLKIRNYWINVAEKGNFQEQHNHIDISKNEIPFFSGVLYIKVPKNSGKIIFPNPLLQNQYLPPNKSNPLSYEFIPQEGLMLLFPSWLEHFVEVNKNSDSRISVSWNTIFTN